MALLPTPSQAKLLAQLAEGHSIIAHVTASPPLALCRARDPFDWISYPPRRTVSALLSAGWIQCFRRVPGHHEEYELSTSGRAALERYRASTREEGEAAA